jgi:hypothetical protein
MPEECHLASGPLPSTLPPLAVQEYVRGSLSGSLATTRTSAMSPEPTKTELLSTEQEATGGWLAGGGGAPPPNMKTRPL